MPTKLTTMGDRYSISQPQTILSGARIAWDYLVALNTGHSVSITTVHSDGGFETYDRLAVLVKQSESGGQLDLSTLSDGADLDAAIDTALGRQ